MLWLCVIKHTYIYGTGYPVYITLGETTYSTHHIQYIKVLVKSLYSYIL